MSDPAQTTFRERLEWAMKQANLTNQSELARRIGVKPQSIQHLLDPKKNAQGSAHTANLAQVLKVSPNWLATGEGSPNVIMIDGQHRLFAALRDLDDADVQRLTADPEFAKAAYRSEVDRLTSHPAHGVAHDLSQARNTESLPRIRWEDLMTVDLSQPFELEVKDDALAPEIFTGCIALLDPDRAPEPAWPVLVRDRDGNHYLRDYETGPGTRWSAVARARGFSPMDSEAFGLTIIAAMDGYKRPRPTAR